MENCIVKNLIASIPGDMPVLGRLTIRGRSTGTVAISTRVTTAQNIQIVAPNGSVIKAETVNPGGNVTVSQDCSAYDYVDFLFDDKYQVERISCLSTSPASSDAIYDVVSGDINYMGLADVLGGFAYMFPDTDIVLPEFSNLSMRNGTPLKMQGIQNIARLSNCIKLTSINIASTSRNVTVSGDLKDFLEKMCVAGRESGTLSITINRPVSLSWGNVPIVSGAFTISIAFSETGCTLTKTSGTFLFDSISYNKTTGEWS